jgi:hypothetical protein
MSGVFHAGKASDRTPNMLGAANVAFSPLTYQRQEADEMSSLKRRI